jgi:thioredoxin 1
MRPLLIAAFTAALTLFSTFAPAAEIPFDQTQFAAARDAGKPVAVVFHADWCPTCRAQAPVLKELSQSSELKPLTLSLRVTQQSTIVVFKGGKEVARSTGATQRESLAALLRQAVS